MPRASRVPAAVGLIAVVPAVAGVITVLWSLSVGVRNARVEPNLYAAVSAGSLFAGMPAALFVLGLLVTAGLVLARRAAARSALVWLASTGSVLVLMLCVEHYYLLNPEGYDIWIGPSRWIGGVATVVALGALTVTAICLGIPAGRRALARPEVPPTAPTPHGALTETDGAPAPLRRSVWWLGAGGASGIVAFVVAVALDSMIVANAASLVGSVLFAGIMVVGAVWAAVAAAVARQGRLAAANMARAGGAILLVGQWLAVWLEPETALIGLGRYPKADDVPAALGVAMFVLGVAGIVATLIGLAGLADPRTERYIREARTRNDQWVSWGAWTGGVPVPAQIVAPQEPLAPSRAGDWSAP